ncbi:TrkH family potassium uptake protein [Metabacillus arenae]|uniref:Ktr system potassium transporter B n=1 Tax=Metabacillus arenae TaxID=2771434 RepID=A0A926NC25_9BACI|nr:TrkH family potassium uptake protein [Metabacillus arenae]MBD1380759.1 Ktr system potassium transporter B [Metabacillus arenae]
MKVNKRFISLNPSQLLILVFAFFISLGTIALKLPIATTEPISWVDALFTSTSAMTVTGLSVVDTGTAFTVFGQVTIIILIQLGGLGIMSFAVLIYIMLGRKIGIKERLIMQHALNQTSLGGVIKLVKNLFIFSFTIEFIGMLFLATQWVPEFGWGKGMYISMFHAVSAFNNAGFSLFSDYIMGYVGNPVINIAITFLFIIGGIGFTVLADIIAKRKFKKLSLHSKMMLVGTLAINIFAMLVIFVLEYSNPNTIGPLDLPSKLWASYFQAVTPRTAGFNSVDIGSMYESSLFLIMILMFIGAGSASTGGGIKLTTALVIVLAAIAFIRGKSEITIAKRSISHVSIIKSLAITTVSIVFIVLIVFILNIVEKHSFTKVLFEVISAFGTVGLSMGITADLTDLGKQLIIFMMFVGKLGPLTLMFSLSKPKKEKIRYPQEDLLTG